MQSKEKDSSRLSSLLYERYLQIKRQGMIVQLQHQQRYSQNLAYLQCSNNDAKKLLAIISLKISLQLCDLQGNILLSIKSTQYQYKKQSQSKLYLNKKCIRIKSVKPDEYILVKSNATISILKDIYYKKIKGQIYLFPKLQEFIDAINSKIYLDQQDYLQYNYQNDLNQDQNKAIHKVFQNYITFIKGPPGCGKTKTVSRMVRLLAEKRLKIIVGSVSNIANYSLICQIISEVQEHNYLYKNYGYNQKQIVLSINYSQVAQQKLALLYPQIIHYSLNYQIGKKILQINQSHFYNEDNIMQYIYKMKRNENIQATFYTLYMQALNIVTKKIDIMISTTINSVKINTKIQQINYFRPDIGILDQAAQASWGDGYIFLSLGIKRLVLVGDQKQLAPTVIGDAIQNKILKQTMFESLAHLNQDYFIQLTIQYRMHPQIAQFPNQYIYEGKLKNGINQQNVKNNIQYFEQYAISFIQHNYEQTVELVPISNNIFSNNYSNLSQNTIKQYYNQYEALLIMQFLQIFPDQQLKNVGIITFYDMQNQLLLQYLKQKIQKGLLIKTIDGYQGGQKDYIILSTVRCNSLAKIGFCNQQNRVNVSLTRAKKGLIIFGNPYTLMQGKSFQQQQHNIWGNLYKFIYKKNKVLETQTLRNLIHYHKTQINQNYHQNSQKQNHQLNSLNKHQNESK